MIFNPVIVKGGGAPVWQELKIDSSQDVPVTRAGAPAGYFGTFELRFEQLPIMVLFRELYSDGQWIYSVAYFTGDGNYLATEQFMAGAGVSTASLDGTTISGTIHYLNSADFLPIYSQ